MSEPAHLDDRALIRLAGGDRQKFLQGLITQDIEQLAPNRPLFAALLTPQGKILFEFFIFEDGPHYFLDCTRDLAPGLLKRLTLYKLRADISLSLDESLYVCTAGGAFEARVCGRDPRLEALGWRGLTDECPPPDDGAYSERRITLGAPELGADFRPETMFLTDVNYDALGAVSYKKGCFVGQEVSSRMKRKGDIRKRTLIASFDSGTLQAGDKLTAGQTSLGEIVSARGATGLAIVRMDRLAVAIESGAPIVSGHTPVQLRLPEYLEIQDQD